MPSKWSTQDVEEYLAKFDVENAVQQAVNSAIRARAADPILHIADFLEARGTEVQAALDKGQPLPSSSQPQAAQQPVDTAPEPPS